MSGYALHADPFADLDEISGYIAQDPAPHLGSFHSHIPYDGLVIHTPWVSQQL